MKADRVKDRCQEAIIHSWSVNATSDPCHCDADGVYIIDPEGRENTRFFPPSLMCVNVGHKNKKIIKAIQDQAEKSCYLYPGLAYESRSNWEKSWLPSPPGDLNKFLFTLGGAEANDNANQDCRTATKKHKILSPIGPTTERPCGAIRLDRGPTAAAGRAGHTRSDHVLDPIVNRCPVRSELSRLWASVRPEHIAEVIQ